MIACPICKKEMKCINSTHLKTHYINMIEFKIQFPNFETHSEELKEKNKKNGLKGIKLNNIIRKEKATNNFLKKINEFKLLGKKCKQCENFLEYKKFTSDFCNHSCAAKYNNVNRTVNFTIEGKEKQQETGLKNLLKTSNRKGIRKYFDLNCCICKKDFKVTYEKKLNKTCSKECRSKLFSQTNHRENNTSGKYGYYQEIYCASSWELAFLITNLDLGHNIERCKLTFTYVMNGEQHTYFPDFIMNGIIYEIKGYEKEDVKLKTEAVMQAGYKIEVIRKKEILPIIKAIKNRYDIKDITVLYDQKEVEGLNVGEVKKELLVSV
jgi:hypothetical protein